MNDTQRTRPWFLAIIPVVILVSLSGCRSTGQGDADRWKFSHMFDLNKGMPWHSDGPEVGIPAKVAVAWTDGVRHTPGQKSERGFGGRLHFYRQNSDEPIAVDGQLVVYAFDETKRESTDNRPTKRYVFPPEQLKQHMTKSTLGPSYSVWLPWDGIGGPQTEVSLICRFEPRGGSLVIGEQNRQRLAGTLLAEHTKAKTDFQPSPPSGVQPAMLTGATATTGNTTANFEEPAGSADAPKTASRSQMTTTTISLPKRHARK